MYSSLRSIDLVSSNDGAPLYIQTDHRTAGELESEPELSTLFAITRVLGARRYAAKDGKPGPVLYALTSDEVPAFLVEVLAAVGAQLGTPANMKGRALAQVKVSVNTLADRAFAELAERVLVRSGVTDAAVALKILEAETLADPVDVEADEIGYWTRVFELAAVTGEIVRKRRGGSWVESDRGELPFGFELSNNSILFPTNRASRFIDDGTGESMFRMIETLEDQEARDEMPILPSLRSRGDVDAEKMIFRALFERVDDPSLPVIAYGTDSPTSFGLLVQPRDDNRDELHAKALANLAAQEVALEELALGGHRFIVVTNSFFATEKLLDRAFMRTLHEKLGAELLAVAVPRRGLMFVTNGAPREPLEAMAILSTIATKEFTTSRKISTAILGVSDGEVVAHIKLDQMPPPAKKPGFFSRLFGRN